MQFLREFLPGCPGTEARPDWAISFCRYGVLTPLGACAGTNPSSRSRSMDPQGFPRMPRAEDAQRKFTADSCVGIAIHQCLRVAIGPAAPHVLLRSGRDQPFPAKRR